jgi:nucleoside recognition membrane protein YjiH
MIPDMCWNFVSQLLLSSQLLLFSIAVVLILARRVQVAIQCHYLFLLSVNLYLHESMTKRSKRSLREL